MKFKKSFIAAAVLIGGINSAFAETYSVTVTNTMSEELLAPVLVAPASADSNIFDGHYVTAEAETQILTGDPASLAGKIGSSATVAHGEDGPPGVLLAPGKSITFDVDTDADLVRIISMVAPTMVPDNFLSAVVDLNAPLVVTLDRYDIGHDEGSKNISHVKGGGATVSVKKTM